MSLLVIRPGGIDGYPSKSRRKNKLMISSTTHTVALGSDLELTLTEAGTGRPVLILHGGGGPFTVAGIADHLAGTMHTITPTHPGWNGTARPEWLAGVDDLALAYLSYLEDTNLRDVLVIGSSLGGWIGCEMAFRDRARLITGLILIDAVGIKVEDESIRDIFALNAREVAEYSFHDAERFYVDPASVPAEQASLRQANMDTMREIAGEPYMHDPKLLRRLGRIQVSTLAIWGVVTASSPRPTERPMLRRSPTPASRLSRRLDISRRSNSPPPHLP